MKNFCSHFLLLVTHISASAKCFLAWERFFLEKNVLASEKRYLVLEVLFLEKHALALEKRYSDLKPFLLVLLMPLSVSSIWASKIFLSMSSDCVEQFWLLAMKVWIFVLQVSTWSSQSSISPKEVLVVSFLLSDWSFWVNPVLILLRQFLLLEKHFSISLSQFSISTKKALLLQF